MRQLVQTPTGLVLQTTIAVPTTLSFDDLSLAAGAEARIGDGYGGFDWTQTGVYSPDGAIPGYVAASGSGIAFIAEANGNEVPGYEDSPAGAPAILTRDTPFDLVEARFTAAFRDGLVITATAYADEAGTVEVGQKTFVVDRASMDLVSFTEGLDFGSFLGISRVEFTANDGDASTSDYFGFDDLVFATPVATEEAVTVAGFEDFALSPGGEQRIPDGYLGFDWSETGVYRPDGAIAGYRTASGNAIGFIAEANGNEVPGYEDAAAGSAAVLTRATAFDFLGGGFSAAFRDGLVLTVRGYADEAGTELTGEATVTLSDAALLDSTFLDGTFDDIRRLEFVSNDGNAATSDYFGFDDLLFVL